MPNFSHTLEETLHRSLKEATDRKHEFLTTEHLLLALTHDPDGADIIRACGGNTEDLRDQLRQYLDNNEYGELAIEKGEEPRPTSSFQRTVRRAVIQASGRAEVTSANVLVALFSERDDHAVWYLLEHGLSRFDVVEYIKHGVTRSREEALSRAAEQAARDLAEAVVRECRRESRLKVLDRADANRRAGSAARRAFMTPAN